jgi:hypothetical protein
LVVVVCVTVDTLLEPDELLVEPDDALAALDTPALEPGEVVATAAADEVPVFETLEVAFTC